MSRHKISAHEVAIYQAFQAHPDEWFTNQQISAFTKGIVPRTIRGHTLRLVKKGLVDQRELFPGNRYRWSGKEDLAYALDIERAAEALRNEVLTAPAREAGART